MYKRFTAILFALFILACSLSAQDDGPQGIRRFGLFVGVNDGGSTRQQLRWAVSDARKLSDVMTEVGGILPGDALVLEDPGNRAIDNGFERINRLIDISQGSARRFEFVFYYSGHSDETGLLLGDEHLSYADLREKIQLVNADVSIAILDSCASGAFTRSKGGERTQPFLVGDNSEMSGHAFLTSSSADELSQESDRLSASYFTHYMISGLRGAADHSGDRRVTLNEAYEYAFNETLSVTASSLSGPQHPSYNISLSGSGDLVLTDLSNPISSIVLDSDLAGRIFVKDGRGNIVAEINKADDKIIEIALDPGIYSIDINSPGGDFYQYQFNLSYRSQELLRLQDFIEVQPVANRTRGGAPVDPFIDPENPVEGIPGDPSGDEDGTARNAGGIRVPLEQPVETESDPFFDDPDGFFDDEDDFFDDDDDFFKDDAEFFGGRPRSPSDLVRRENSTEDDVPLDAATASEAPAAPQAASDSPDEVVNQAATLKRLEPRQPVTPQEVDYRYEPFYAGFVPGMGFPQGNSRLMHNNFAFSPIILESGMVTGFQMSGVMGFSQGPVFGSAMAGVGLEMNDNLYGAALAGVFTINNGHVYGAQISGVFNIAMEESTAFQSAGIFNIAEEPISGAQVAGIFNTADHRMDGAQIAGIFNETGTVNGVQIAGVFNSATQVNGAQIAAVNTTKNGNGVQTGLVNIASGRMNGLQIGLINVADDLYGVPIGLISWVRQGIHDISYWTEDESMSYLATANGSRNFYTVIYGGVNNNANFDELSGLNVGLGWGMRINLRPVYFDLEASMRRGTEGSTANERLVSIFDPYNPFLYPSARFMAGVEFLGFGFFLGVSMDLELEEQYTRGVVRYNGSGSGSRPIEGLGTIHHRFVWGLRL
jgi:hypothetical protein